MEGENNKKPSKVRVAIGFIIVLVTILFLVVLRQHGVLSSSDIPKVDHEPLATPTVIVEPASIPGNVATDPEVLKKRQELKDLDEENYLLNQILLQKQQEYLQLLKDQKQALEVASGN